MKTSHWVSALIICAAIGSSDQQAHAYSAQATCHGVVKWAATTNIHVDTCTIPVNSSPDSAIFAGVTNWGFIYNQRIANILHQDYGCHLTYGDAINEVMLVTQQTIGSGLNGLTTYHYSTCFFSAATYDEADIITVNTMNYEPEDESFWDWSNNIQGAAVMAHELGHFIGLGHAENFDIMRAATPIPLPGGVTGASYAEPFPDDANGARWLYGGTNKTNVFSSAEAFVNNSIVAANTPGTINVCRGSSISVTYTVANNGTTAVNGVGFRVYVGASPTDNNGVGDMFVGTATSPAGTYFTETRVLTVPNISNGVYWILWKDDTGNAVGEIPEGDNRVHSAMTINVVC